MTSSLLDCPTTVVNILGNHILLMFNIKMHLHLSFFTLLLATHLISLVDARKSRSKGDSDLIPCPEDDAQVCIDCTCNPKNKGYNICKPADTCPEPLKSASEGFKKDKAATCPYGETFSAICVLCQCSGFGQDHCAMCFALPVRRGGQPDQVNKELPQNTDNKFTNYEINGWAAPGEADEEEEEEEEEEPEEKEGNEEADN